VDRVIKSAMIPLFKVLMADRAAEAVAKTLFSGLITEGPRVLEFEDKLSSYLQTPILTVNSGTSALHLAAVLLDLAPGDEVISTPITCVATNVALLRAGATIVWADVDPRTGLLDPKDIPRRLSSRTRAIMCVDWGGALCDFEELCAFGLPVIEDAAHAFGARRSTRFPDFSCWSFQAIKHLTAADGGGLHVEDAALRERARKLRWFGIDRRAPGPNIDKTVPEAGFKFHMNDVNATIGLANFEAAVAAVEKHRQNAAWFGSALHDVTGLQLPPESETSAWWLYTILLEEPDARQDFITFMAQRGIECSRVHARNDQYPAFARAVDRRPLPGADHFDRRQVAIPVGWWIGDLEREQIAEGIRAWSHARGRR
jgi:dTDP-4-amino-4,6-dideoxygalactose transaminase